MPCPPAGDIPNPGIGPRCPALQADSAPSEPPGRSRTLEWAYPFSTGSYRTRNLTGVSCMARRFFTNWATKEVLILLYSRFSSIAILVGLIISTNVSMWSKNSHIASCFPDCRLFYFACLVTVILIFCLVFIVIFKVRI